MEKGKKYMKLIIQVPCYNEEKTLELAYNDLPRHIDGIDTIEYLIINDGSKDKTVQRARELGFHHVVSFRRNKGLARGFMAGLDACLRLGADIIVNTDADNQYCGEDIEKLVRPILERKADMVIGERPIDETEHFSWKKKKFQHLGSWVVRVASNTDVPDAPSGFRAYSRETAMRMNVVNEYTYTLETIIQAGQSKMAVASVPIRTNPETRPSRLFSSMWRYMKRSASVIIRSNVPPAAFLRRSGNDPVPAGRCCGSSFSGVLLHGRRTRPCAVADSGIVPDDDRIPDHYHWSAGRYCGSQPEAAGRCAVSRAENGL